MCVYVRVCVYVHVYMCSSVCVCVCVHVCLCGCVLDRERNSVFASRALVAVSTDGSVPDPLQ